MKAEYRKVRRYNKARIDDASIIDALKTLHHRGDIAVDEFHQTSHVPVGIDTIHKASTIDLVTLMSARYRLQQVEVDIPDFLSCEYHLLLMISSED